MVVAVPLGLPSGDYCRSGSMLEGMSVNGRELDERIGVSWGVKGIEQFW